MIGRALLGMTVAVLMMSIAVAETPLCVMSFNVRYGLATDRENSWEHRKDILVNTIRQFSPDVFGTQECLDFQAEYVAQALPDYRWFGVGREADGKGEYMAVFYKKDVLGPMETGNFWLSETPEIPGSGSWDTACNRMATWARFHHYGANRSFYFFNTHLDHKSGPAREGGARVIAERISKVPADTPVILTGDFNATAEKSEPYGILTGQGLSDAWVACSRKTGPAITFGGFKAPKEGEDNRIDWILFAGPAKADSCETVLYNEDGKYPSDHYPIVAKFTLW